MPRAGYVCVAVCCCPFLTSALRGQYGNTALVLAASVGHVFVIECLLANGADVDDKGYVCETWL